MKTVSKGVKIDMHFTHNTTTENNSLSLLIFCRTGQNAVVADLQWSSKRYLKKQNKKNPKHDKIIKWKGGKLFTKIWEYRPTSQQFKSLTPSLIAWQSLGCTMLLRLSCNGLSALVLEHQFSLCEKQFNLSKSSSMLFLLQVRKSHFSIISFSSYKVHFQHYFFFKLQSIIQCLSLFRLTMLSLNTYQMERRVDWRYRESIKMFLPVSYYQLGAWGLWFAKTLQSG